MIRPWLWTLGVNGPGRTINHRLTSQREAIQPQRGVAGVLGSKQRKAKLARRQQSSSNRIRRQWSGVDPQTLDQQKRSIAARACIAELSEEPPTNDREVKVTDALPFDHSAATHEIVAGDKRLNHDACAKPAERGRNAAEFLMNIRHDGRLASVLSCHGSTVASRERSKCVYSSHKVRRK